MNIILSVICIVLMSVEVFLTYIGVLFGAREGNVMFRKISNKPIIMLLIGQVCIVPLCILTLYLPNVISTNILMFLAGVLVTRCVLNFYVLTYQIGRRRK